jgi:hypothetical protein
LALVSEGPRCAEWARSVDIDPVGTAGCVAGFLLLDWPLPWPRDASEIEPLAPIRAALEGTGIRLQLTVPRPDCETRSVVLHRQPPDANGWFTSFQRRSCDAAPGEVVEAAVELLAGGGDVDVDAVDVLVCGHGSRDRCCGSLGTALAMSALAAGMTVRRTSHTGGHRFAPTGLVLPTGTAWAFLDEEALHRVVARQGPLDDLLPRYRGCTGLASPAAQAVERCAFGEIGWTWLDHRRRSTDLGDGRVRLDAVAPDGSERSWEAEIERGRVLPVPECGNDPALAAKSEAELVVRTVAVVPSR